MAIPVLKPSCSWFAPNLDTVTRNIITIINFVDTYTPSETIVDSWDASVDQDGSIMCYVEDTTLTIAGNGSGSIMANIDSSRLFSYGEDSSNLFSKLTAINGLTLLDTSNCENMERMFRSCSVLETVDISNFNTSKVKNFSMWIAVSPKLPTFSVAHLDTSACEDMSYMFYGISFTTIDFENWDVSKVKSFDHFLSNSNLITNFDVSKWDVSSCENFNAMFNSVGVSSYDLSNWDVSNVKVFSQMFEANTNLTEIIGLENWNTSNGICFEEMFSECTNLKELNLSSFNTMKAHSGTSTSTNGSTSACTKNIFKNMYRLEKITLGVYFTFLGDGTSSEIGTLPTPSSTYIDGADGNWYSFDENSYAPVDIPNLTHATYYASQRLAQKAINANKYLSYTGLTVYDTEMKSYIDKKVQSAPIPELSELVLIDVINGYQYILQMQNGHLVSFCSIESIEITSSPKLTYEAGESFDSAGMVLTATCHDGTTRVISNYTVSPEILSEEDTYVTVHYIEGGKEYTVDIDIEILGVEALLTDFTYTKNEDGTFTLTGWNGTYNGEASTKCVIPSTDGKVEI